MVATPSGTTFGEVATYTCNPEYELIGDGQRTYEVGGWSGAIPECCKLIGVKCMSNLPWYSYKHLMSILRFLGVVRIVWLLEQIV